MGARSGMASLISRLRVMVNDGGSATWTGDQLEDLLDARRVFVHREKLQFRIGEREGGAPQYKEAFSRYGWFEETGGGTARFVIEDVSGTVQGTALWTVNYIAGHVSFAANQKGSARYLTGYAFDLHAAAADCWRDQAGITSAYYNFQQGQMRINRSEWFDHCMKMAQVHDGLRRPEVVEIFTDGDF